jgi:hypothetical protein
MGDFAEKLSSLDYICLLKDLRQFQFSVTLILTKAWFTQGHKWTFPHIPETISEILLKFDMEDYY